MKKPDKDKLYEDGVFCILPWISAYINTDSTTWSCCVNKAMTDHSYLKTLPPTWKNDISIMENSVEDLMNNDYFKKDMSKITALEYFGFNCQKYMKV